MHAFVSSGGRGPAGADGGAGATGPAGSANATGTANTLGKFTGTTTVGDSSITDDGSTITHGKPTVINTAAIGNTKTTTFTIGQANASSGGTTQQFGGTDLRQARAFVSSADRTGSIRSQVEMTATGVLTHRFERDLGAGAGFADAWYWASSSPTQAVSGVVSTSRFISTGGAGTAGLYVDSDNSAYTTGSSGQLVINSRNTTAQCEIKGYATSANIAAVRIHAAGEAKSPTQKIVSLGSGTSPTYTEAVAVMGDGTIAGPRWVEKTAQTSNYTAAARERVPLTSTGGAFDFTLPTAVGCAGQEIKAYMTAASANVVTLKTTSAQTISGSASAALTLGNVASVETGLFTSDGANWWFERSSTVL